MMANSQTNYLIITGWSIENTIALIQRVEAHNGVCISRIFCNKNTFDEIFNNHNFFEGHQIIVNESFINSFRHNFRIVDDIIVISCMNDEDIRFHTDRNLIDSTVVNGIISLM
jgi:hypothetical protein